MVILWGFFLNEKFFIFLILLILFFIFNFLFLFFIFFFFLIGSDGHHTCVFDFKLIHPRSCILIILISHYLPVQTHPNNYGPTFSNFFGESKEIQSKLHCIILILW